LVHREFIVVGYNGARDRRREARKVGQEQKYRERSFVRELVPDWWPPTRDRVVRVSRTTVLIIVVALNVLLLLYVVSLLFGITLWSVLKVMAVPIAVGAAVPLLNWLQKGRELAIADQHAQDEALQSYLKEMGQLLLDEKRSLRKSEKGDEVRTLARARTLTVLARLDGNRRTIAVQFLYESRLISGYDAIVNLKGADLSNVDLGWNKVGNISGINLRGAKLEEAKLEWAFLGGAFLDEQTNLSGANLRHAILRNASLSGANLEGANLEGGELNGANLRQANLSRSVLRDLLIWLDEQWPGFYKQLAEAKSLKGATMHDGEQYEDWLGTYEGQDWLRNYKPKFGEQKKNVSEYEDWIETTEGKMWLKAVGKYEENSGSS
jgi:uncharacterized protein YjbI with pentapeptide repeats